MYSKYDLSMNQDSTVMISGPFLERREEFTGPYHARLQDILHQKRLNWLKLLIPTSFPLIFI